MRELQLIGQDILASGKVDSNRLESLRSQMYSRGKIGRPEVDLLVELHKRLKHSTPAFEQFFYQAIKDHILQHGRVGADQAAWLRRMLFADGKFDDAKRKFLRELKGEAGAVSGEFELLFEESMNWPPEQHTCG